ncbi:MAG: YegP family protein [Mycobacteriaceae bacterium]
MPAEVFKRHDGKWAFQVKAANGQIVATDGGQGYDHKADAVETVTKRIRGDYHGAVSTP